MHRDRLSKHIQPINPMNCCRTMISQLFGSWPCHVCHPLADQCLLPRCIARNSLRGHSRPRRRQRRRNRRNDWWHEESHRLGQVSSSCGSKWVWLARWYWWHKLTDKTTRKTETKGNQEKLRRLPIMVRMKCSWIVQLCDPSGFFR